MAAGVRATESDIKRAFDNHAKLADRAADATGRVRAAQAALTQVRNSGNTARIVAAEERYSKALRDQSAAARAAKTAQSELKSAQSRIGENLTGVNALTGALRGVPGATRAAGFALAGLAAGALAGVATAAAGAVAALGGLALVKGFERLKTIDEAKFKLQALGNSAADVQTIMDSALTAVKGTAFGLGEAATIAANAVAAGVKPGEELTKYLTLTADASAIAGTSLADMGRIINQVRTGQKAYTEDLNQLADRGIPIYQWLAEEAGVAAGDVKKLASEGGISAAMFEAAIAKHIGGAAQTMGQSFSGAVQNAEAALGRLGAAFLGPVFGNAAGGVGSVTEALDGMTTWVENNQETIIGFWVGLGDVALQTAQGVLDGVGQIIGAVATFAQALGDSFGFVTQAGAAFYDLIGQDDRAAQWRAQAEGAFGFGDGLMDVADNLINTGKNLDGTRDSLQRWGENARNAAAESRNADGSIVSLGNSLRALPLKTNVDVTVSVEEAQRRLDEFFARNENRNLPVAVNPNIPSTAAPGRNPLDVVAGRSAGGYTGNVPVDRIAGVVHGDEHVIRSSSRRRIENAYPGLLDFLNKNGRLPIPGYAEGGYVDEAIDFASSVGDGRVYRYGGTGPNYDCSGFMSAIYAKLTGKSPGQRHFTTESDFESLGFLPGSMPGAFNIGIKRGGGGRLSHMAGTLPNGVNVESGGGHNSTLYGGAAQGADAFPLKFYLPVGGGDPGGAVTSTPSASPFVGGSATAAVTAPTPSAPSSSSSPSSSASSSVSLPSSLSGFGSFAGEQIFGGLADIGKAAGSFIDGQVGSVLDVFGIGDSPPWLQALSTFVGGISIGGSGGGFEGVAPVAAAPGSGGSSAPGDVQHGARAGQQPGPQTVYNITARDTEDAFIRAQRQERERAAAKLSRF